jgi:Na+/proline symporter
MSLILGWDLTLTALFITVPAVIYTMWGGVQAVTWTDVKIMALIVFGLVAVVATAVAGYPDEVSVVGALQVAGTVGRLQTFEFSFDFTNQYTFWSGTIAALFLFCSYFGTDQSQVQRFLTARSVDEARHSLLMSAYWKIPLQVLVLMLGIFVFVFYIFNEPPLLFSSVQQQRLREGPRASEFANLQREFGAVFEERRTAASELAVARREGDPARIEAAERVFREREASIERLRAEAATLVKETTGDSSFTDVNYIIPTFILNQLPIGLVGLLIVAILLAATDTIAGELNALSTASVIDFYRRWVRPSGTDAHYLAISRAATGFWGLFACVVAVWAAELGSLIEVVNRFGSFFYGSILGVFILAIGVRAATANGAFIGLLCGMTAVAWFASFTRVAFLWHNVIGAVVVVGVGLIVSAVDPRRSRRAAESR